MVDKDYKDCKHRRLCKTAKKGKWFDCQIAGKGFNCDSTKEWCKYEPYKSVVLTEYNPPREEPTNWERMSNEQSMEIEHLQEQLQASKKECEKKDNQIKILKEKTLIYHSCKTLIDENTALKQQLDISVEFLKAISNIDDDMDNFLRAKTALDKLNK